MFNLFLFFLHIVSSVHDFVAQLRVTSYICVCSHFRVWQMGRLGIGQVGGAIIAGRPPLKGYFERTCLAPESSSAAQKESWRESLFGAQLFAIFCFLLFLCTVLQESGKQRSCWVISWWACLLSCWSKSWCCWWSPGAWRQHGGWSKEDHRGKHLLIR